MGQQNASRLEENNDRPKFRMSWDGLRYDGEYRNHRFSASFYARDPYNAQGSGCWLLWHYWSNMALDDQGFAVHPTTAPNGWPCTGYYRTLEDVQNAIQTIVVSIDNPNVIVFRPKAFQTLHVSMQTDGPLVA